MSRVAPYSPAETAEAASWLDYLAGAADGAATAQDRADALSEAIDKAHRRACLSSGAAALLSEVFDVPGPSPYALA